MLILARHGQTAVNAGGRLQGRADAPLTDHGHRQAAAAAAAINPPALVVCSPLQRAQQTASYFGAPVVDDRWTELDYGDLDGLPIRDVPASLWDEWRGDESFAPPGGESLLTLGRRVREACEELAPRAASEDIVVVSHVSPIKAAVAWALDVGDRISWRMFLDVAALVQIGVTARGPTLLRWNDTSHLRGL